MPTPESLHALTMDGSTDEKIFRSRMTGNDSLFGSDAHYDAIEDSMPI